MRNLGRRSFLFGTGLLALASTAETACDNSALPSTYAPPAYKTVRKDVHFDLAHLKSWSPEDLAKVHIHIAGKSYPLKAHDATTRRDPRLLSSADPDAAEVTHYADNVVFSALGPQSYVVGVKNARGYVTPLLAGIHVPSTASGDPNASPTDEDPVVITTAEDAAVYCVFHNPQILTLDAATAQTVVEHIADCPSFNDLIDAINAAGAITPAQAEEAASGWIVGTFVLDKAGNKVPRKNFDGKFITDDRGNPVYDFHWTSPENVANATTRVVAEALERFHNDASLDGVKYHTGVGVGAIAADAPRSLLSNEEHELDFIFHDQGLMRGRRSMKFEREHDNRFKLEVKNPNALGCFLSMRALDKNGKRLDTKDKGLGYVPGTFYPSVTSLLGPASGEFVVDIPANAAVIDFCSAAIAAHGGDMTGSGNNIDEALRDSGVLALNGAIMLSGLLDFLLPTTLLAIGLGGEPARGLSLHLFKEIVQDVGYELLIELGKTVFVDIINSPNIDGNAILANLSELATALLAAVTKAMGTALAVTMSAILAEVVGIAAVESAGEAAVPIVGWVLKGIAIAETLLQLAIQVSHIESGQLVVRSRLEPAHEVELEVIPDPEVIAFLPQGAVTFAASITPEGRLPVKWTGSFDPSGKKVKLACPKPVPLQGTLTCEVKVYNVGSEMVGIATTTVANATVAGSQQQVECPMKPVAIPIRATTKLDHVRKLAVTATARTFEVSTVIPPGEALNCGSNTKVCLARGITVSQKLGVLGYSFDSQMACRAGSLGTQAHLVNIAGPPVVKSLACGEPANVQLALDLTGGPSAMVASVGGSLRIFQIDPTAELPALDASKAKGILQGKTLTRARMHKDGKLVALTELGVEVVDLSAAARLGRPADPSVFFRRGQRLGQMSGPVSVAPLPTEHGYVLLEAGSQGRVQALDFAGNPLTTWGNASFIALPARQGRVPLDVDVDRSGNVWVLSYTDATDGAAYKIDVYDKKGSFVVTFSNVPALSLATDAFGTLFTENAQSGVGPAGYAEPTLSVWTARNAG